MITVTPADSINDLPTIERCGKLYVDAFTPLAPLAIQRHIIEPVEFSAMMRNAKITKWLAADSAGSLRGLAVSTNHLDQWPLIEPLFFAHRWPDRYAQRRCWYVGFVCTDGTSQATFPALLDALAGPVRAVDGVAVMDYCGHRFEQGISRAALRVAARHDPRAWSDEIDTQHYVAIGYDSADALVARGEHQR